jgi:thioredoxin reductase (NADPH)
MAKAEQYDLIVIGAGPAGMAAAINGESEGINTLVLDAAELGGQARTSTLIENIPGFPEGITGAELTQRTVAQALRFDTEFVAPYRVERVESAGDRIAVYDGVDTLLGRAVLLSTGVQLRRLPASNVAAYLGRGASYGSPNPRIDQTDRRLFVVGGANSAGQG